ncbi:hypothetical protein BDZ91DRAFT_789406 [Kalaharituber pfeilii]|nr:hypothetical protein BDZ91DRAFT_789406 [Kalaharituber pfeilii]
MYSSQDARSGVPPNLDLDSYSASTMMADLGPQRIKELPLSGRRVVQNPHPVIQHVSRNQEVKGESVHDWSSLLDPNADKDLEPDGLGLGGSYRCGPNYRPDVGSQHHTSIGRLRAPTRGPESPPRGSKRSRASSPTTPSQRDMLGPRPTNFWPNRLFRPKEFVTRQLKLSPMAGFKLGTSSTATTNTNGNSLKPGTQNIPDFLNSHSTNAPHLSSPKVESPSAPSPTIPFTTTPTVPYLFSANRDQLSGSSSIRSESPSLSVVSRSKVLTIRPPPPRVNRPLPSGDNPWIGRPLLIAATEKSHPLQESSQLPASTVPVPIPAQVSAQETIPASAQAAASASQASAAQQPLQARSGQDQESAITDENSRRKSNKALESAREQHGGITESKYASQAYSKLSMQPSLNTASKTPSRSFSTSIETCRSETHSGIDERKYSTPALTKNLAPDSIGAANSGNAHAPSTPSGVANSRYASPAPFAPSGMMSSRYAPPASPTPPGMISSRYAPVVPSGMSSGQYVPAAPSAQSGMMSSRYAPSASCVRSGMVSSRYAPVVLLKSGASIQGPHGQGFAFQPTRLEAQGPNLFTEQEFLPPCNNPSTKGVELQESPGQENAMPYPTVDQPCNEHESVRSKEDTDSASDPVQLQSQPTDQHDQQLSSQEASNFKQEPMSPCQKLMDSIQSRYDCSSPKHVQGLARRYGTICLGSYNNIAVYKELAKLIQKFEEMRYTH